MLRHVIFVFFISRTLSISSPGPLTREVGEDVVFMFNATNIVEVLWGIPDGDTNNLRQGLISYNIQDGVQLDKKLNSSSYAGRVSFVGNSTKGHAWFKIKNLNINDTNEYMAKILIQRESNYRNIPVKLTVILPTITTAAPTTSTLKLTSSATQDLTTPILTTNPPTLTSLTTGLKVNEDFVEGMEDSNSSSFEKFSKQFNNAITGAFKDDDNFKSVNVISLRKGSIYVEFVVFFKRKITNDKACASLEVAIKGDKLGDLEVIPGSLECSKPDSSTPRPPSPTTGVHPGIIAGVVVVGILAIAGLVIAILFVCRKKSSHRDYRGSTSGQEYAVKRRAGEPEEQYACVQRSGASGAAVGNKDNAPLPQYAAVDKNKKTKKKTRGPDELVYADLDHEYNKSIGARRPSDRHPTNDSGTVYADIQGSQGRQHPQQRQPPPRYGNLQAMDYA